MYLVRDIMHCKPGKVRPLLEKFKKVDAIMGDLGLTTFRFYTDLSGERFWTLVMEAEVDDLDQLEREMQQVMANEAAAAEMAGYHDFVDSGRREIYRIES